MLGAVRSFLGNKADPSSLVSRAMLAASEPRSRSRQVGAFGTQIIAGMIEDIDENTEVRGEKWYGSPSVLGWSQKMMRDAHVRRSWEAVTRPLRAATWDFQAPSKRPKDIEAAKFASYVFFERIKWDELLRLALTHYRDGFSLFEVTYDTSEIPTDRFPLHPGGGTGVVYTGFHHRPAWTLEKWIPNKDNPAKLDGVQQWVSGGDAEAAGTRDIPADALLRFTHEQEGANFAGLALLRSAYGPWKVKRTMMVLEAIRQERQGVGTPSITLGEDGDYDDEVHKAETILAEMRSHEKGYLILPHGYEFSWNQSEGMGTNIGDVIERCNRDIAYNVAAGFMLLGLSGNTGSWALAQTQAGHYEVTLDGEAKSIADTFNFGSDGWSPVERIIRLNYGPDVAVPRLVARNMPTRDWLKAAPHIRNLADPNVGVITPDDELEDFMRQVMFLPQRDPATARERRAAAVTEPPAGDPPDDDAEEVEEPTEQDEQMEVAA